VNLKRRRFYPVPQHITVHIALAQLRRLLPYVTADLRVLRWCSYAGYLAGFPVPIQHAGNGPLRQRDQPSEVSARTCRYSRAQNNGAPERNRYAAYGSEG